jgi:hypothetical protein
LRPRLQELFEPGCRGAKPHTRQTARTKNRTLQGQEPPGRKKSRSGPMENARGASGPQPARISTARMCSLQQLPRATHLQFCRAQSVSSKLLLSGNYLPRCRGLYRITPAWLSSRILHRVEWAMAREPRLTHITALILQAKQRPGKFAGPFHAYLRKFCEIRQCPQALKPADAGPSPRSHLGAHSPQSDRQPCRP